MKTWLRYGSVIVLLIALFVLYGCHSATKSQMVQSDQGAPEMNDAESTKDILYVDENEIEQVMLTFYYGESISIVIDATHHPQEMTELMSYINGAESFEGDTTADLNGELSITMADGTNYDFFIGGTTKFFESKSQPRITYKFITQENNLSFEEWAHSILQK